jgi:hypothetical protein
LLLLLRFWKSEKMAMAGLYRRILPSPPAIDFASAEGKVGNPCWFFYFFLFFFFFY